MGYADELICAAVLKAISPGNNLRTYLENKKNLTVTSVLGVEEPFSQKGFCVCLY